MPVKKYKNVSWSPPVNTNWKMNCRLNPVAMWCLGKCDMLNVICLRCDLCVSCVILSDLISIVLSIYIYTIDINRTPVSKIYSL